MRSSETTSANGHLHPAIWAAGFTAGMAAIGYLEIYAGIGRLGAILLMIPIMAMLIPMTRSVQYRSALRGCASPALTNYNRRFMGWTFGYMAALTIAITIQQKVELSIKWKKLVLQKHLFRHRRIIVVLVMIAHI